MELTAELKQFLLRLFDIGAIQFAGYGEAGFRFKFHEENPRAPLSPVKLHLCTPDVRPEGRLTDADIGQVGELFAQYIREQGVAISAIAGLPNAGSPLALALQKAMLPQEVTCLSLLKATSENRRHISGLLDTQGYKTGSPVWMVDDVATRGHTKGEGAQVLRREGCPVENCLVFLSYGSRPVEELLKIGVTLHAVVTMRQVIELFLQAERITSEQYGRVLSYIIEQHNA